MIRGRGRLSRLADPLFMLPLATSAVTLGFGFIIALDEPPLNLRASWLIIPISHTLVALPFVIRSVLPSLRAIPPSLGEAARTLGAKPLDILLTIDLPLLGRGIAVGATFAFTVSMGEFGASALRRPARVGDHSGGHLPVDRRSGPSLLSAIHGDERRAAIGLRLRLRPDRTAARRRRRRILMLRIERLSHAYGDIVSLRDVELELD